MVPSPKAAALRCFFTLLLCSFLLAGTGFAQKQTGAGDPDAAVQNSKTDHKDDPGARARWFLRGRTLKGENSGLLLRRAYRQKMRMRQAQQQAGATQLAAPGAGISGAQFTATGGPWTNIGPAPITGMGNIRDASGRIVAATVDQCDTTGNTVLMGAAYGGVWRSTNAAAADPTTVTWSSLYDYDPAATTLAVGAVSLQPGNCSGSTSNVILVGTGEPNNAGDSYYGQGILRSTNGGSTWSLITSGDSGTNSFAGMGVSRFAWSTTNTNLVVAAFSNGTLGFGLGIPYTADQGIYYSTDAGATWHKGTNVTDGTFGSVSDVVWNASASKFFAAFKAQGIYSSSDGINWTRTTAQPVSFGAGCNSSNSCDMMRAALTVLPGAADMYAWVVGSNGTTDRGIAKTTNGGTAWAALSTAGIDTCGDSAGCGTGQGFYDLYLTAVPNGTSTDLYAGAVNLYKCTIPSGQTGTLCSAATSGTTVGTNRWMNLTHVYGSCGSTYLSIHPDNHATDFLRGGANANKYAYFVNDGGAYRTLNSAGVNTGICASGTGNPFDDLNTSSLGSISQFVYFSQDQTDSSVILGGTQDNGSPATASGQTNPALPEPLWYEAWGGDGGFNQIDNTGNNWYVTNTDVTIQKCTGSPGSQCIEQLPFSSIVGNTQVGGDHGAFYTPFMLDPADNTQLIVGTCKVWRGPNTSTGWSSTNRVSPAFETGYTAAQTCTGSEANLVSSLAAGGTAVSGVSPVIYAGTAGGHIWVTTNANLGSSSTWTDRTGAINPGSFPISYFILDGTDSTGQTAYVTIMGFTGNSNGAGHLFKTTNAGTNWTDVGIGLPDAPADAVAIDPNNHNIIYAATDVGVFVSLDAGAHWQEYGTDLPNVAAVALRIFNSGGTQKLRVATHGRGVWETGLAVASDYTLAISNPTLTAFVGDTAVFNGTLTSIGGYSNSVALSCIANGGTVPGTCTPSPSSQTPSGAGATFTVSASNATAGDFPFAVRGVGTDGASTTHSSAVTLHAIDFQLADGADISMNPGDTAQTTLALSVSSNWPGGRVINGSCAIQNGPVTGMSCQVTPSSLSTNGTFTLQVTTTASTPPGAVNITVTATDALNNTKTRSQTIAVTVTTPTVTVVAPNGGESWAAGSTQTIRWNYTNYTGNVVITLLKANVAFQTLATVPVGTAGSGSYLWTLPATLPVASDYTVKVATTTGTVVSDTSNAAFSVTAPGANTITVTSPAGGEAWTAGSTHTISWNYTGLTGNVSITLLKSGSGFLSLGTVPVGTAGSGSFNWTLPMTLPVASDYRIRISSTSVSLASYSNGLFSVTAGIQVSSPNGGEAWAAGSTHAITWKYDGVAGNVNVALLKAGSGYLTIANGVPVGSAGSGSVNWTLPMTLPIASDYTVRVSSATTPAIVDVSNAAFSVTAGIQVTSPNGGESWPAGSSQTVSWKFDGVTGNVNIALLKAGSGYLTIANGVPVGTSGVGSFNWTLPSNLPVASDYTVRVSSVTTPSIVDVSNATFSVAPKASITVVAPNGGESWLGGSTQNIQWNFTSLTGTVNIALLKAGSGYLSIATGVSVGTAGAGSFSWNIPTSIPTGSDYTVRVSSASTPAAVDVSNASFTITQPSITVVAPNGGETWTRNTTHNIQWNFAGNAGSTVKIELFKSGVLNRTISASTSIGSAGSGQFSWAIPSNQTTGTDFKIKVTSTTVGVATDSSNANFTIN